MISSVSCERDNSSVNDQLYVELLYTLSRSDLQGAACFGDYLFQLTSQNNYGEDAEHGLMIVNLKTKKEIQFIELDYNINFHNSHASFGNEYYDIEDPFPLLYLSQNNSQNSYYKIHVYRVVKDIVDDYEMFSLKSVQTIDMPSISVLDNMQYPHAVVDRERNLIWIEGYSKDGRKSLYMSFNLPSLVEGERISLSADILDYFSVERKDRSDQSYCISNNKSYQVIGYHYDPMLRVIGLDSQIVEQEFELNDYGLDYEPQAIFFWGTLLCVTFANKEVYSIAFPYSEDTH